MKWSEISIAAVRQMARDGYSMSVVGRRFGVTKSAIAGVAYRNGFNFEGSRIKRVIAARRRWAMAEARRA